MRRSNEQVTYTEPEHSSSRLGSHREHTKRVIDSSLPREAKSEFYLADTSSHLSETETKIVHQAKEHQTLLERIIDLERGNQDLRQETISLNKENQVLEKETFALKAGVRDLQNQTIELKKDKETLENETVELRNENQRLANQSRDHEQNSIHYSDQCDALKQLLETAADAAQSEQAETANLREQVIKFKREITVATRLEKQLTDDFICAGLDGLFYSIQDWALQTVRQTEPGTFFTTGVQSFMWTFDELTTTCSPQA